MNSFSGRGPGPGGHPSSSLQMAGGCCLEFAKEGFNVKVGKVFYYVKSEVLPIHPRIPRRFPFSYPLPCPLGPRRGRGWGGGVPLHPTVPPPRGEDNPPRGAASPFRGELTRPGASLPPSGGVNPPPGRGGASPLTTPLPYKCLSRRILRDYYGGRTGPRRDPLKMADEQARSNHTNVSAPPF